MNRQRPIRDQLESLFRQALAAVDPAAAVRSVIESDGAQLAIGGRPLLPGARIIALAVGKAAQSMARELEAIAGTRIADGLAVIPGNEPGAEPELEIRNGAEADSEALARFSVYPAAHPVPDARSERAGREAISLVSRARADDVLVAMISGGASSLMSCPAEGIGIDDLALTTRELLRAGADIDELNAVRKHLSRVAGGRLAAHVRCERVEQLVISDVPGDRLDVIGSGPLAGDRTSFRDALDVLTRHADRHRFPDRVLDYLQAGARGELAETPGPDDAVFRGIRTTLLASNATALRAAAEAGARSGLRTLELPGALHGSAREAGRRLAALGRSIATDRPTCANAGGETTVEVRGAGQGGRSQELALAAALAFADAPGVSLLAVGTDGVDGPTDAAGAFADHQTVARGRALGLDARAALESNDSHRFFACEGGVVRTGPTGTNVMDLAFLYVAPRD